ncbi:MAG: PIG-L family deacetylase [Bacteroidetes bacterium]|jgi:LmbE family N-acetylglucosaminyl deacetylase|nr:PIG-L family deacetylase [Bacteroidota bacterium]
MASLLYVFPHPDDESFGPAPALARQRREGHAVHLLTLTRGEATKERHKHGLSKEEMGVARFNEMQGVAEALDLSSMEVLSYPDGRLAAMDPRVLEQTLVDHIRRVKPDVVITYAVHGISGHPDHLVSHAVLKRVFCDVQEHAPTDAPRRLAFFTLPPPGPDADRPAHLTHSAADAIQVVVEATADDLARGEDALACYETYRDVVEAHQPLNTVRNGGVCFELFGEAFKEPLADLTAALPAHAVAART